MFDLSFSELLVVGLIALVVLGPKRLPEVARTAGTWIAKTRRFVSGVKQEFDRELQREELTELRKLQQELTEAKSLVEKTAGDALKDAKDASLEFEPDYLVKALPDETPDAGTGSPASPEPKAVKKRKPRKRTTTKRAPRKAKPANGQENDKPV